MTREQLKSLFVVYTDGQDEWIKADKRTYDKAIDKFCDAHETELKAKEDGGRTWFLEDGVEFFKEKLQAKEHLQYKISLIISEMEDKMGLSAEEIASALGISEGFTYRILKNKDLPGYELNAEDAPF